MDCVEYFWNNCDGWEGFWFVVICIFDGFFLECNCLGFFEVEFEFELIFVVIEIVKEMSE